MSYAVVNIKTGERVGNITNDIPNPVVWPNGDASHGCHVGDERVGYRVVEVVYGPPQPNKHYSLSAVTPELNGNTLNMVQTWTPNDLGSVLYLLAKDVDAAAEAERLRFITPGAGQAMVYLQKRLEATAYLADPKPDSAKYPILAASVVGDAALDETAKNILSVANSWTVIAATIEKIRLAAKAAIASAPDVDTAVKIASAVSWS